MADTDSVFLYLVGTAGSGKTRLTAGMKRWAQEHSLDAITVNLDPGADALPYTPDVDIREWVQVAEIMEEHGLGPNGAQVVAADMLALRSQEVLDIIDEFETDYVLLDTPGQVELFVFREAGRHMVERFAPGRTALAFLVDPFLARTPAGFATQMLLAATTQFRFQVPMVNLLSKSDMLESQELEKLLAWVENPDLLYEALTEGEQTMHTTLTTSIFRVLEELGATTRLTPVSSETLDGLDDLYQFLQSAYAGAEDLTTR
jgi:GPN-loop GTPase